VIETCYLHPMRRPSPAAAVLARCADGRVLLGARTHSARSWPGTLSFPGGGGEEDDDDLPLFRVHQQGHDPFARDRGTALREAIEEAGLWHLCRGDGSPIASDDATVSAVHARIVEGSSLSDALRAERVWLDDREMLPLVRWLTWEQRFLVQQFLLPITSPPVLRKPLTVEMDQLSWAHPVDVLADWRAGRAYLTAPIRRTLDRMATAVDGSLAAVLAALREAPTERDRASRELVAGVQLLDGRTPTLAPATHTNCAVLGSGDVLLVDPATPYLDEHHRFDRHLALVLHGRKVSGIVLTHHHPDHVGDAVRLQRVHRCPIMAHPLTAQRLPFAVDKLINEGDVLALRGPVPRSFKVLFTPGHAPGHICLWDEQASLLIAGDMVAGVGSIIIDPPDGHMGTYMASLERLIALSPRALVPAHGSLLTEGVTRLQDQLAHRWRRQRSIEQTVLDAAATIDDRTIVERVYVDVAPNMWPFALRAVAAALEFAVERKVLIQDGDGHRAA
jgi:endoribonuclease LACTB2